MSINRSNYEIYFIDYLDGTLSESDMQAFETFLLMNPDLASELEGDMPVLESDTISFGQNSMLKPLVWDEAEVTELYISQLELRKDGLTLSESDQFRITQFEETFPESCNKLKNVIYQIVLNSTTGIILEEEAKLNLLKLESDASHTELIALLEGDLSVSEVEEIKKKLAIDSELVTELDLYRRSFLVAENVVLPISFKNDLKRKTGLVIPLWFKSAAASAAAVAAVFFVLNTDEGQLESAFVPRVSTYENLSYDSDIDSDQLNYYTNVATGDDGISKKLASEPHKNAPYNPYNNEQQLVAQSVQSNGEQNQVGIEFAEPLVAMAAVFENKMLLTKIEISSGELVNSEFLTYPEIQINQLPVGDDLAEVTTPNDNETEQLTAFEYLERKVKEKIAPESEQGMALAFVNNTARKLTSSEEDLIAYEKETESNKGFKFRLGGFAIERNR